MVLPLATLPDTTTFMIITSTVSMQPTTMVLVSTLLTTGGVMIQDLTIQLRTPKVKETV